MALHGDLTSIPLPELLQWLDGARKSGALTLAWEGGERKLFIEQGHVVAAALPGFRERIARLLATLGEGEAGQVLAAFAEMGDGEDAEARFAARGLHLRAVRELVRDELLGAVVDLTLAGRGQFHWTEDGDRTQDLWAPAELGLRELLFESLRWMDEQPEVDRALPFDSLTVRARRGVLPPAAFLPRVLVRACGQGQHLGKLRLTVGSPRSAINRRLYELMRANLVEVEGAPRLEADPVADMLEKGAVLVREAQYDAAGLICSSLLASDPADRRVREFARLVLLEHVAALYAELPPVAVAVLVQSGEALSLLKPEERQVAGLVNGSWDVSTLVLASPVRELDTLRILAKLVRLGLLHVG